MIYSLFETLNTSSPTKNYLGKKMFLIYVILNENEALEKAITLIMDRTKKGTRIINFEEMQKFKK